MLLAVNAVSGAPMAQSRVVNITPDSEAGWLPTVTEETAADDATAAYFKAIDDADYKSAYSMMNDRNKAELSFDEFEKSSRMFHDMAGQPLSHTILYVTWTKDPAAAPFPGIYAALDITAKYRNVDRYCGYVVFYQKTPEGPFSLMRTEQAYIDESAAKIEKQKGVEGLRKLWAQMYAHCPNYKP